MFSGTWFGYLNSTKKIITLVYGLLLHTESETEKTKMTSKLHIYEIQRNAINIY